MSGSGVLIIGGGLAGVEAAYQVAKRGMAVELWEMRPASKTEAHLTPFLGEMVCSNSLGSMELGSASGLLKEELRRLDSFFLRQAEVSRVPAGNSLSVDRMLLAERLTAELEKMPEVTIRREEATKIPDQDGPVIISTGPLTSGPLAEAISCMTMRKNLFFYDATSPLLIADSIDFNAMYAASRYDKGEADFFNIPLDQPQYDGFVDTLTAAELVEMPEFEKHIYFDACLPVEEIARRGHQSLAFGPLKPVGLPDPRTGKIPYAVVQLRTDDVHRDHYQMVGFQTRLKWGEQKRVFRMLPGLEKAEFERFGRMHRNTYINAPLILSPFFQFKLHPKIFFAGQISGVEGYVESVASGLLAGFFAVCTLSAQPLTELPGTTAIGSLARYISHSAWKDFKPSKFSFGLLPDQGIRDRNKKNKKEMKAERALEDLTAWIRNSHF